jgi:hypothetical protein
VKYLYMSIFYLSFLLIVANRLAETAFERYLRSVPCNLEPTNYRATAVVCIVCYSFPCSLLAAAVTFSSLVLSLTLFSSVYC